MFDLEDSDFDRLYIKPTEEETRKLLDSLEWEKMAELLATGLSASATTLSEAWSPIIAEVKEDKEEIEMTKIEKDTETLVDSLANYKDSYFPTYDFSEPNSIVFDDGKTAMVIPVAEIIDKLIDFLIN